MVAKVPKVPKKGELEFDNIYLGDSIEGMKLIPDASIDLVITSPPYSDMKSYEGGFNGFHPDNYIEWFLPYVSEISRILKPTGSFILNINDKADKGFRHPFVFQRCQNGPKVRAVHQALVRVPTRLVAHGDDCLVRACEVPEPRLDGLQLVVHRSLVHAEVCGGHVGVVVGAAEAGAACLVPAPSRPAWRAVGGLAEP